MIIALVFSFGLLLGSFVNALVWRIHQHSLSKNKRVANDKELSISRGRSMCPNCQHTLAPKDLVPVFSWLYLRGKCRYCKKPISAEYPLIELLTGVVFVLYSNYAPISIQDNIILHSSFFILLVFYVALAVYDFHWFLLPNRLVYPLNFLTFLLICATAWWQNDFNVLLQAGLGAAIFYGIFRIIFEVSKGKWIGYGDVRLAVALGFIAGTPLKVFLVLFVASLLGTLLYLPSLFKGGKIRGVQLPFGPYLIIGSYLVLLWGQKVLDWYQNLLV